MEVPLFFRCSYWDRELWQREHVVARIPS